MTKDAMSIALAIGKELNIDKTRVFAAIRLLDEGATVPFIARYRKEATQELSDTHLRTIAYRLGYLRELEERREVVLASIREQDQLTPDLERAILQADTKTRLEDLYLPHRPKRRTKAHVAKEAGLGPLADLLLADQTLDPLVQATNFINVTLGIDSAEIALEGARQILMERFAEEPDLLATLRDYLWAHGVLNSKGAPPPKGMKKPPNHKFADYVAFAQPIKKIPSHRALALFRGRKENALQLSLTITDEPNAWEEMICTYFHIDRQQPGAYSWLMDTVRLAWSTKLASKLELELFNRLRDSADEDAITVFAQNLRDLLLAAPAGAKVIMGLDPGIRTGVKAVVVDELGHLLDYDVVFPMPPQSEWNESIAALAKLAMKHKVDMVSIGNGTGSRETERLVADLISRYPDLALTKVLVSEAGASVYSASELAANEFPDLDVTFRGAVSIARRLQDPLAELVKIEAKSIGVGQYQHDVNQSRLARCLDGVVEDCVNAVGVDLNLASAALLARVSGMGEALAKQVVRYREEHGAFHSREDLKKVPRLGDNAFQQAAGFLRILQGAHPLDASGVHPESYAVVETMIKDKGLELSALLGQEAVVKTIEAAQYVTDNVGLSTIQDILRELEKPGRDPRPQFKAVCFKDGIDSLDDLQVGMILEGVVSNVTHFGAFVNIGVHQDGLVHISAITNKFIRDPHEMLKAGDIVTVKVTQLDKERKRISLTMKLTDDKPEAPPKVEHKPKVPRPEKSVAPREKPKARPTKPPVVEASRSKSLFNTAMADALSKLKREIES